MWTISVKLQEGIDPSLGVGTLTAVWDDPAFTYSEQGTADDKENFLDRAEIALEQYIKRINVEADLNDSIQAGMEERKLPDRLPAVSDKAAAKISVIAEKVTL